MCVLPTALGCLHCSAAAGTDSYPTLTATTHTLLLLLCLLLSLLLSLLLQHSLLANL